MTAGGDGATVTVRVEPAGLELAVRVGGTIFAAAAASGVAWPTLCGGAAICTRCAVEVGAADSGALAPMAADEEAALRRVHGVLPDGVRLACQARVLRGLTVVQRRVRCAP